MAEKDRQYKISVVMAVYNTEEYLHQAIDSIIHQTMNFKEYIQLILVDDGSTDRSGAICEEYKAQYEENVVVVHQANQGRAAASNTGLPYIEGKYVNFLDSDDYLSAETCENVYEFFEKHEEETDIVSIPMMFFEKEEGPHILNYKYEKGSRVVSLWKDYNFVQLHIGSAFIKKEKAKAMVFDTTQVIGIDAMVAMKLIAERMTLGLCKEGTYYYRRRESENLSILQAGLFKPKRYAYHVEHFSLSMLQYYKEKFGVIPYYAQFAIMYDLQSRIKQKEIPEGVLTEEEKNQYVARLKEAMAEIEDFIIMEQTNMYTDHKYAALYLKHGRYPAIDFCKQNDAIIRLNNTFVCWESNTVTCMEKIAYEDETLTFSGRTYLMGLQGKEKVSVYAEVNGVKYPCTVQEQEKGTSSWLFHYKNNYAFEGKIAFAEPLQKKTILRIYANVDGHDIYRRNMAFEVDDHMDKEASMEFENMKVKIGTDGKIELRPKKKPAPETESKSGVKNEVKNVLGKLWRK